MKLNYPSFNKYAACLLRIWCGIIFIKYGLSVFYFSSIKSFAGDLETVNIPFPLLSAYLSKWSEFIGGILLVLGLYKIIACFFLVIDMTVATFVFHHAQVLANGLTTFLLLLCLLNILSNPRDKLSIDFVLNKLNKL